MHKDLKFEEEEEKEKEKARAEKKISGTPGNPGSTISADVAWKSWRIGSIRDAFSLDLSVPVVNIAGCPTHPGWVTETLMALAAGLLGAADLDALQRPRFYADQLVHHGCTRNEYYEFKASAEKPSDLGCMMEHLGCKGTQAHADCNVRPWNGVGSCVRGGFPCIACTEPGFEAPGHPFLETPKVAGGPLPRRELRCDGLPPSRRYRSTAMPIRR